MNKNTTLRPVQLPKGPWLKGAVDIVGPIDNKYLVTYVNYFSSFPAAAITRDISSKSIVKILMNIFARHGYPEEIVSDNGPQFVSQEFNCFLSSKGLSMCVAPLISREVTGKLKDFIMGGGTS